MPARAVVALGIGQCVNWGVLYYAFAVLVVPLQRELGVATWVVTGAFSAALLMSATLAPAVGRLSDRDRGAHVMQIGGFTASALLALWSLLPGVTALYISWAGLGLCMAATLYEPAFAIVGRAHADPAIRLRALGAVTLFGGLASTVFLPVTAVLLGVVGWRRAVLALAAILAISTWCMHVLVLRDLPAGPVRDRTSSPNHVSGGSDPRHFVPVAAMFTLASLASGAFTANLMPALGARGVASGTAAILGGLIGVMQLPGRVLLMSGVFSGSPATLLSASLLLHAAGLGLVAAASSTWVLAAGTAVFALGAGLTTLVRPHLIQTVFGVERGGYLNGRVARQQQFARAGGPILLAWLGGILGYGAALAALAGVFALAAVASREALGVTTTIEREAL